MEVESALRDSSETLFRLGILGRERCKFPVKFLTIIALRHLFGEFLRVRRPAWDWNLYGAKLGFFLKVEKLKRYSKNLVQPYPTKFISAIKFLKTTFLEMRAP